MISVRASNSSSPNGTSNPCYMRNRSEFESIGSAASLERIEGRTILGRDPRENDSWNYS